MQKAKHRRDQNGLGTTWKSLMRASVNSWLYWARPALRALAEPILQYGYIRQDQTAVWKTATPTTGVLMAWHTAWVTFPPGQPVTVERRYRVANGGSVYNVSTFQYITATGAGWRGTIGRLDADVTLEGRTVRDLAWKPMANATSPKDQPWCVPNRSEWKILSPTHLHLTWKDFEPRTDVAREEFILATLARVSSDR